DERARSPQRLASGFGEKLHETQTRASAAVLRPQLELVRDRLDDGDAEPALDEVVVRTGRTRLAEPLAVVDHLDGEPVLVELVEDLDCALGLAVRMSHRVGAGLGDCELEVGERLLAERPEPRETGQREPSQRNVLGLGRDRQPDGARVRLILPWWNGGLGRSEEHTSELQ